MFPPESTGTGAAAQVPSPGPPVGGNADLRSKASVTDDFFGGTGGWAGPKCRTDRHGEDGTWSEFDPSPPMFERIRCFVLWTPQTRTNTYGPTGGGGLVLTDRRMELGTHGHAKVSRVSVELR